MNADDVLEVLDALAGAGARAWLDGGWAIDALAGEQTREHADLDLAVDAAAIAAAADALGALGYREDRDAVPGRPARVVFTDARGRQVDLHPLVFDDGGTAGSSCLPGAAPGACTPRQISERAGSSTGATSPARARSCSTDSGWATSGASATSTSCASCTIASAFPPRRT